jgi:uncharacterized protein YjbI with pentapeptide repeats
MKTEWAFAHKFRSWFHDQGTETSPPLLWSRAVAVMFWVLVVALLCAGILALIKLPRWQVAELADITLGRDQVKAFELENEARKTLTQIALAAFGLVVVFLTWRRLLANDRNVRIIEQGHITDRYTRAIEQLGKLENGQPNIEVRLGGIYALERLAFDSPRDHVTIMEVLSAYVRRNAPWVPQDNQTDFAARVPQDSPRTDIQAILTILSRRRWIRKMEQGQPNLAKCDLRGAHLAEAQLEGVDLSGAQLEGADLRGARLERAQLRGAHLERAQLRGAHLEGANLVEAQLDGVDLSGAHLEGADLLGAHLQRARLSEAHLEGANLLGAHLERAQFREAHLEGANLCGAHLEGAHLVEAQLDGVDLSGSHLEGADLLKAHLNRGCLVEARLEGADLLGAHLERAQFREAHLERAQLREAHLEGADLRGAHLEGASLFSAHLEGAYLIDTHLEGACFIDAYLEGANLRGAHLEGANHITVEQVKSTKLWRDAHYDPAFATKLGLEGPEFQRAGEARG